MARDGSTNTDTTKEDIMTMTPESPPMLRRPTTNGYHQGDDDAGVWRERTRLVLTPIAAPSIVGFFGLGAAAFLIAANWAGWYAGPDTPMLLAPFVIIFGGLVQLAAAAYAFRARDGVATAVHGTWGAMFASLGVLWLLAGTGVLAIPVTGATPEVGLWFGAVAVITLLCAIGAASDSLAMMATLAVLGVAAGLACGGFVAGISGLVTAAGWTMLGVAILSAYTAGALMLDGAFRREILPHHLTTARPVDGAARGATDVIEYPFGMPGAHAGQ
jgi:succinate-acetate transporter protein